MQIVRTGGLRNRIAKRTALFTSYPTTRLACCLMLRIECGKLNNARPKDLLEALKMSLGESLAEKTVWCLYTQCSSGIGTYERTTMPRRIGRVCPEGVGTDYLTDNQLYERVGQADAVYIERKPPDHLGAFHSREWRREGIIGEASLKGNDGQGRRYLEASHPLSLSGYYSLIEMEMEFGRFVSLRMLALGGKCEPGVRDIRQFDPYDKRTTARFPFIGTPDIRSRKTLEDQQGDEFMVVSYDCREREEKEKRARTMAKGWPEIVVHTSSPSSIFLSFLFPSIRLDNSTPLAKRRTSIGGSPEERKRGKGVERNEKQDRTLQITNLSRSHTEPLKSHPSSYIVITKKHAIEARRVTSIRQQENHLYSDEYRMCNRSHVSLGKEGRYIPLPSSLLICEEVTGVCVAKSVLRGLSRHSSKGLCVSPQSRLSTKTARMLPCENRERATGFTTICSSNRAGLKYRTKTIANQWLFAQSEYTGCHRTSCALGTTIRDRGKGGQAHLLCVSSGGGVCWTPASSCRVQCIAYESANTKPVVSLLAKQLAVLASNPLPFSVFLDCFRRETFRTLKNANGKMRIGMLHRGLIVQQYWRLESCQGSKRCVISDISKHVERREQKVVDPLKSQFTPTGIEMDRSFKNNADFKMNQQNFKLSDFGIDVKSGLESKTAGQSNQCKVRRSAQVSQRNAHVQQVAMSSGRALAASGTNLLQIACNRSRAGPPCNTPMTSSSIQHNSNQPGQMQNASVTDRFQASSPGNLSVTSSIVQLSSSPNYWKQYGGQESGHLGNNGVKYLLIIARKTYQQVIIIDETQYQNICVIKNTYWALKKSWFCFKISLKIILLVCLLASLFLQNS
ncbi:hypothetical protein EAG_15141 [Camponotus floridanus]|uniref:Uncharacterized protein n=1 Tax=Camponotus floridanus TaxID=104421 RepID=E1ZYP2_CAMFO|nr:hypothetical protein EAG_15141 [Camponotus floridanus]